jgi:16S rRNA processing protein RimM
MASGRKICVGQFAGAHGVRGLVKLRSFTAKPEDIFVYAPLTDKDGERVFKIAKKSAAQDTYIVEVEGVDAKEAADQLRGDRLYVPRDLLPKTHQNEYYEADLMGLSAVDKAGKDLGKVLGVFDYGAGIFLEIGSSKKDSFMLPFKNGFVPEVDLNAGKIVIVMPEEVLPKERS